MAKRRKTSAEVADKWSARAAAAGDALRKGIEGVTESPMEKAAGRADAYQAGVIRAVQTGRFQRALRAVSLQEWKQAMISKGIPRQATGVQEGKPKFRRFMDAFLPFLAQTVDTLDLTNPRGDLEANIARSAAMIRALSTFTKTGGGGAFPLGQ